MMSHLDANPIPGAELGVAAGFSPDGQWIVYARYDAKDELQKIPATGGTSVPICDLHLKRLAVTGLEVPVAEGVGSFPSLIPH